MTTFSLTFTSDLDKTTQKVINLAHRQIPFAASVSMNRTVKELIAFNKIQMKRRFKRPNAYTLNAFRGEYSRKTNLRAGVVIKDKPGGKHYLPIQTKGGTRGMKGIEKLFDRSIAYPGIVRAILPTKREAGGKNGQAILTSRMNKALAGLGASYSSTAYTRDARRAAESKQNLAKRSVRYFLTEPGNGAKTGGVWRVNGKKGKPQKLYHILDYSPQYQARLPFKQYMTRQAVLSFPKHFRREFRKALRTARFGR